MNRILGIRLHNLEIYNWGTFDKMVWKFSPCGNTALLTGDSGSGKSTIVDALSTLLVQPRRLAYNKAADASARERSVKSYVLGYYGRKYAYEGKGKPEKLRDERNYSVILATFKDESRNKTVSLAIFFWFKDNDSEPTKLYAVSEKELFIAEDFSKFQSDVKILRSRLRQKGVKVFDSFSSYGEHYRKLLDGLSEQAVDLFQQTISMKKVEALNEFVKESMLEKEDIQKEIEEMLKHYENLNSAYEAVIRAKDRIEKLTPIVEKGQKYIEKTEYSRRLEQAINSHELWFATKYKSIFEEQSYKLGQEIEKIVYVLDREAEEQVKIKNDIRIIEGNISRNGGNELAVLENDIKNRKNELKSKKDSLKKYNEHAMTLGLKAGSLVEAFDANKRELPNLEESLKGEIEIIDEKLAGINIDIQNKKAQSEETEEEILSLSARTSNIPAKLVRLRERLCAEMKIDAEEIPFVGELLEVKEAETMWEGAIERLTHSFAISILVPDVHYAEVSKWVNKRNLGAKLVYFKVGSDSIREYLEEGDDRAVSGKLIVKPDSSFAKWLRSEVSHRFPHICCESIEEFRKERKAITMKGQIRSGQRHEKDDRHEIQNRLNYVLGFSNKKKIEALNSELDQLKEKISEQVRIKNEILEEKSSKERSIIAVNILMEYKNHDSIDVFRVEKEIEEKGKRIKEIKGSSDILKSLEEQRKRKDMELKASENKREKWMEKKANLKSALEQLSKKQHENEEKLKGESEEDRNIYEFLESDFADFAEKQGVLIQYSEKNEKNHIGNLNRRYSSLLNTSNALKNDIEKLMIIFKRENPIETSEMTDDIESLKEYGDMLKQLLYDNLPKYQSHFKDELRGKITRHISLFHVKLQENSKNIVKRIQEINQSLRSIPYNAGRYITLNCEETVESDIRNFRSQLRACTEGMTTVDDELAEQKFIQIKEIIGRFKGRTEYSEADRRWTAKVTDVRNWFIFSATERYIDNDEEYEHYSDSDGKSGGQKEKLAYTILAASLAYNYKLNRNENAGAAFRLVVIDEAFLKSSDESAKFGLSLFKKMRFQLLVVTPLLKIATIEPFISHVGFVSHDDITHTSQLKNISIQEYRENRKIWKENGNEKMDRV